MKDYIQQNDKIKIKYFTLKWYNKKVFIMKEYIFFSSKGSLIRGIIALIVGGLAIFVPDLTLKSVVIYFGILILLGGVVSIFFAISSKNKANRDFLIIQSLFNLIIGLSFLIIPTKIVNIFIIIIGIGFLVIGIFQLIAAFNISRYFKWSWFFFITSMLTIIAGIIMLTNPFESAKVILIFIGILLLIYGLGELLMAWQLSKRPKID